ncbi:hypothetical protein QUF50_02115 [Thiotrichales bacterium HSG1]|nr:hypothetical protein [Thiotrichales bacterium HSG1]
MLTSNKGTVHHEMLNAKQMFKNVVRKQWERINSYLSKTIEVELNLAEKDTDKLCWRKMCLLFVRGTCDDKTQVGKHDWVFKLRL